MAAQALPAHAATALGFQWQEKGLTENGGVYENYLVRCSDDTLRPVTHYKNAEGWCITGPQTQQCSRTKNKMFKKVCRLRRSEYENQVQYLADRNNK